MSRYVPTGAIAAGGIGSVVFCEDKNLDRNVAVKFVQIGGEHRRLLDELAALQRIRSKHVVEIFDVAYFPPGHRMGIVEEFIEGDDLTARVGNVVPGDDFVRLIYQMATGLADIHAVGVVHRDIKPSNMRIDKEGILKIIDFNLARLTDEAHTHGFIGTPGFAAPELYGPGNVSFDAKIDVYALGVTAWTLLHGAKLPADLAARPPRPGQWKTRGGSLGVPAGKVDSVLLNLLEACISDSPNARPTAGKISERASQVLLRGQHRALFVDEAGNPFELHVGKPPVTLRGSYGQVSIEYTGLDFRVTALAGEVWVNNSRVVIGSMMPKGCVIVLGDPERGVSRMSITMDVAHPEVVL